MDTILLNCLVLSLALGVFLLGLYLLGRIFIPECAKKDIFFSSPKLGRIKAERMSGKIVRFFDNLVGKNVHANGKTGKIEEGEIAPTGLLWTLFGVYFIGLNDVYRYRIAVEAIEDDSGQLKYIEKDASSIFLDGSYPITAKFVTRDGVRLKVKLQLVLSTLDAAKALSLPVSWTIPVFTSVLGAARDFFGARDIRTLVSAQNEGYRDPAGEETANKNSDFITRILGLNTPTVGNVSLKEICGQKITAVNIVEMDFADEKTREAFAALFIAEQDALATTRKGEAEAGAYAKKHAAIGNDSTATAEVLVSEQQRQMGNLNVLVKGGGSVISIPTSHK